MSLDRTGTFRCKPLDWGIGAKRTGDKFESPNFQIRIFLTEFYDPKENAWFDYTEQEAEITAFLYLTGKIKAKGGEMGTTLSMDQVKKVFGWDGRSTAQLVNGNYSELEFQVRIKDNDPEYADRNPYQVSWIDVCDASPSSLRKLDANELKNLDKQFATIFAKNAAPKPTATAAKAPAKAKAKAHPARVPADDGKPDTPAEKKAKMAAKSAKNLAAKPKTGGPPPKPESKDGVVPPAPPEETTCTMQEAWDAIEEAKDPTIGEKIIAQVWHDGIAEIAGPEATEESITGTQWCKVKKLVLHSVAKF